MKTASHYQSKLSTPAIIGRHVLVDLWDCDRQLLDNRACLVELLRLAAEASHATVLQVTSHQFEPQGITALALLAESHISIHTWPEYGYAAVDILTCGQAMDPQVGAEVIKQALGAKVANMTTIQRGVQS